MSTRRIQLQRPSTSTPQPHFTVAESTLRDVEQQIGKHYDSNLLPDTFDDIMTSKKARQARRPSHLGVDYQSKKFIPIPGLVADTNSLPVNNAAFEEGDKGHKRAADSPPPCPAPLKKRRTDLDDSPYIPLQATNHLADWGAKSKLGVNSGTKDDPIIISDDVGHLLKEELDKLSTAANPPTPFTDPNVGKFHLRSPQEQLQYMADQGMGSAPQTSKMSLLERRTMSKEFDNTNYLAALTSSQEGMESDAVFTESPESPPPQDVKEKYTLDANVRCLLTLAPKRFVKVCTWRGDLYVHIRDFIEGNNRLYPSVGGVSLNLQQFLELVDMKNEIDSRVHLLKNGVAVDSKFHLGALKMVSVSSKFNTVDIRSFYLPGDSSNLRATRRGISLTLEQWTAFSAKFVDVVLSYINAEVQQFVPCYKQENHNPLICKECNAPLYRTFIATTRKSNASNPPEEIPQSTEILGRSEMPVEALLQSDLPLDGFTASQLKAMERMVSQKNTLLVDKDSSDLIAINMARLKSELFRRESEEREKKDFDNVD